MKDFLAINAGRVIFTKFDPMTGALSTDPKDKRICTETIDGITRSKSITKYDIPDGNSNYPAGSYETGVTYNVGINFTTLNTETLAFLQNATIATGKGTVKEFTQTAIPTETPYEIDALGVIVGTPTILNNADNPFTKVTGEPEAGQFKITTGTDGTKQSMSKTVSVAATTAGEAIITITAAGHYALVGGKSVVVNLTASDVNTNASEIRSVLKADPDISSYFDIGGTLAEVKLTRKVAAETESEAFEFTLDTAVGAVLDATVAVAGVATVKGKFGFNAADAGRPITLVYEFEADLVESYDIEENAIHPDVRIEIIHETLSKDKTKKYKNNSIINKATISGNIDENLARQHAPTTLNFSAVKPVGTKIVNNKKTEIPL